MSGNGPFLWFREAAPARAYRVVPAAGFCVSVFVLLRRGSRVLLGRYADHPAWEQLAGLDPDRVQDYMGGWTVPGRHLRLGEHPREAGLAIVKDLLNLDPDAVTLSQPRVETSFGPHPKFPDDGEHFDLWFFLAGDVDEDVVSEPPPWYEELAFVDPRRISTDDLSRCHDEVLDAFLSSRVG